jgi:beta-xylosidase
MTKSALQIFMLCMSILCVLNGHSQNPIIQTIYSADPAPMVYNDTLFLFTGHDEDRSTWFTMKNWHVYATTDMVNWVDKGSPLSLQTFKWAEKDAWAGQCIYRNGKFYWYVPVNAKGIGMSIGVAVSDKPTGPFKDALGKPLITGGWGNIDPTVFIDDNGKAYLYWGNPHLYYVALNEDMLSYDAAIGIVKVPLTDEGFKLRIINAKETFAWAESINGLASHVFKSNSNNKYYWYFSAVDKQSHKKVIGVGIGNKAIGPFSDILGRPLIEDHCEGDNINPTVVVDSAKQAWLTWESAQQLWYAKLSNDMISYDRGKGVEQIPTGRISSFASKIKSTVNSTEKRFTTYEEGPWLYKHNQLYYLFYPAGGVPEHLAYSTAVSALGPWKFRDTIMHVIGKGGAFTNHPGVVDYKNKTYLFYHNGALPGGGGFTRSVCVDELRFASDGSIPLVNPSSGIKEAVGKMNPFGRVQAETIAWEEGIETESTDSTIFITSIDNDDYIKVREVDFGKGARLFKACVAARQAGGSIEVRIDSLKGRTICVCNVTSTGGSHQWKVVDASVDTIKGLHDIYFVFKGKKEGLFDFDWWTFIPKRTK